MNKKTEDILFDEAWRKSLLSPCLKKKVGAVIYDPEEGLIIGEGFGGAHVPCERCVRKEYEWQQDGCWSIHSEMRAVFDALETGENLEGSVAFVTHGPCDQCLKLLHMFGVALVVYDVDYHNDYSKWEGKIRVEKRGTYYDADV